jgi:hypothetical protein
VDHVGNEHIRTRHTDAVQELLQELTCGPDERTSLLILVKARCLTDEHDLRAFRTLTGHSVRPTAMQQAFRALSDLCR